MDRAPCTTRAAGRNGRAPRAVARRPVRRLHGRSRRPRARAARSRRDASDRPRSRSGGARAARRESLAPWRDRVELVHADYRALDAVLDGAAASAASTARSPISACRRCSSTPRAAASASSATSRSTCGWIAVAGSDGGRSARATSTSSELADAIFQFGEERFSRRIARAIVEARREAPIATTGQLAAIVRRAVPQRGYQRIDPATRTFQALRIWVNRELDGLDRFLDRRPRAAARRRAAGRHHVSLARGPHRQAHAPRARSAARPALAGADEEAAGARRRRSRSAIRARAARSCAPRRGWHECESTSNTRSRRTSATTRSSARWTRRGSASCGSRSAIGGFLVVVLLFSAWQHFELLRHGYQIEQMQQRAGRRGRDQPPPAPRDRDAARRRSGSSGLATEQLHLVAPSRDEAIVIERVTPAAPPAKSIVAAR